MCYFETYQGKIQEIKQNIQRKKRNLEMQCTQNKGKCVQKIAEMTKRRKPIITKNVQKILNY